MSTSPEAKLFFGYIQPAEDRERFLEQEEDEDTPWSAIHTKEAHGCIGEMYGYDENLGFFLAVKESLFSAEWDEVVPLTQRNFLVKPTWTTQLAQAANHFDIDDFGLEAQWYLVCLYF